MNVGLLLAELREKQIQIWVEGSRLRCEAAIGTLTPELRALLSDHKAELLEFLRSVPQLSQDLKGLVPIQVRHGGTPVFAVPGHNGDVFCFRSLSKHLGSQQPFYGLQPPGLFSEEAPLWKVEEIAAYFASQIRQTTNQPIVIAGYCAGGTIAFELARQLQAAGAPILLLALFGSPYPTFFLPRNRIRELILRGLRRATSDTDGLRTVAHYVRSRTKRKILKLSGFRRTTPDEDQVLTRRALVERATITAVARYKPGSYSGRIALLLPSTEWAESQYFARSWYKHVASCEEYIGSDGCNGYNMLRESNVGPFSAMFARAIEHASLQRVGASSP